MDFEYKEEFSYLTNICLNMTDDCNLACRYCFVEQHPHYMSLQTAKDSVDWLAKNAKWKNEKFNANVKPSLTFFGGEPMLMWDKIIVPLTDYIEKNYNDFFQLSITTNGTLLSKERIDFLKEHNIVVLLSIDGAPETQNYNRPCKNGKNSFDLIKNNIPYLLQNFPDTTFRATIFQETVEHTFENYLFAIYLGFRNIFFIPNSREKWSDKNLIILRQEIEKIYNYLIEAFQNPEASIINCQPINESFEHVLMHDINVINNVSPIMSKGRNVDRCGLGTGMGSIGYNGNIYGCQEQDSKGLKSIFYIGNIYNGGIDKKKHISLLKQYNTSINYKCENKQLCDYCLLKNICRGFMCPSLAYDLFNNFDTDAETHCLWLNILFNNAKRVLNILTKENNKKFENYLQNMCNYQYYFKEEK